MITHSYFITYNQPSQQDLNNSLFLFLEISQKVIIQIPYLTAHLQTRAIDITVKAVLTSTALIEIDNAIDIILNKFFFISIKTAFILLFTSVRFS